MQRLDHRLTEGGNPMKYQAAEFAFLLALTICVWLAGAGVLDHPKITEEQLGKDIVGKNTGEGILSWQFEKDEPREIKILETHYSGNKATIIIDMKTESAPRSLTHTKMSGRLRLQYEWIANEWNLVQVENLTFKKQ
jgi:hypothetical protein